MVKKKRREDDFVTINLKRNEMTKKNLILLGFIVRKFLLQYVYRLVFILITILLIFSCRNRNPSLSEKELQALMNEPTPPVVEAPVTNYSPQTQKVNETTATAQAPQSLEKKEVVSFGSGSARGETKPTTSSIKDTGFVALVGVRYQQNRAIDPAHPPLVIDLTQKADRKKMKLSEVATSIRQVKIKSPVELVYIHTEMGLSVYRYKDKVILDILQGIFVFSLDGVLLDTVYSSPIVKVLKPGKSSSGEMMTIDGRGGARMCVRGNHILYVVPKDHEHFNDGEWMLGFYDLDKMAQLPAIPIAKSKPRFMERIFALNEQVYAFQYRTLMTDMPYMLQTFSLSGDSLCCFTHSEKVIDYKGGSYQNPEGDVACYFNNVFTFRHAYNDTVFRVPSAERLLPAYILNTGQKKLTINDGVRGNTKNKIAFGRLVETDRHLLLSYRLFDSEGKEQLLQAVFSKNDKKLVHLPEGQSFENDLGGDIPEFFPERQSNTGEMIMIFSQHILERMLKDLPDAPKWEKLKQSLEEDEILLVFIK